MDVPLKLHHRIASAVFTRVAARSDHDDRLVLVLGCMRSGTSLLANILISNPAIFGYGESLVRYRSPSDLKLLQYWNFRFTQRRVCPGSACSTRSCITNCCRISTFSTTLSAFSRSSFCGIRKPRITVFMRI